VRALLSSLFALSAWPQAASVVTSTKVECVVQASVRLVGVVRSQLLWWRARQLRAKDLASICLFDVGSANHCGGRHEM
jgi:hypothetical protein